MTDTGPQGIATLSAQALEQALMAARTEAEARGAAVCIALVDAAGAPAAFLRMPGAFLVSTDLSADKAWSAASFAMPTRGLRDMLRSAGEDLRQGLLRRPRVTDVSGGIPVMLGDRLVGAVGVSGGSEEEDECIASAAVQRIEALFAAPATAIPET